MGLLARMHFMLVEAFGPVKARGVDRVVFWRTMIILQSGNLILLTACQRRRVFWWNKNLVFSLQGMEITYALYFNVISVSLST
jgi:hypothetical protein